MTKKKKAVAIGLDSEKQNNVNDQVLNYYMYVKKNRKKISFWKITVPKGSYSVPKQQ
jgi:hypothetical protein